MRYKFQPLAPDRVGLLPSMFQQRYALNRKYMMSLASENLLQNFYMEAGLWSPPQKPVDCHWGWESPTSQVRGHFLGHWLSGAASIYAETRDMEIKAKADHIVAELARCQQENGGEWVGSIPEKYLEWLARGKQVWAPQYMLHKTMMGLLEMYRQASNVQALDVIQKCAGWFTRWTAKFTRQQMDDILDTETGGMLELWADMYAVTGKQEYLDLLYRYDRPRFFNRLLNGEDALTNMHANTTIPEIQGAARAWEVTGDQRWRDIVEAYWRSAVQERGAYCTGGQTCGEIWTPPGELAARLGDKNQEHCTVYNMMRLAQYLLTWTGDVAYADYWERNLYNGILAQQHPQTG
ncbi:MAG TPA: beta-L-arabinofuranosidase domain-containing protein, partial [Anaerolineae bacterium]